MTKSIHTKRLLADGLIKLANSKNFKEITIKDITDACGLSRHTFYYHFIDKQDLVNWIYKYDVTDIYQVCNKDNWSSNVLRALNSIWKNKTFYINAIQVEVQNNLSECIYEYSIRNFISMADQMESTTQINKSKRDFICRFYAHAFSGMTIDWIKMGMNESPEIILQNFIDVTEKGFFQSFE